MAHLILLVTWPLLSWQPHYPCYGILKATWSLFWYFDSYMVPVLVFWQPYDPYYNILTATWSLFQYFDSHMIPVLVFWQPRDRCSGILTATWSLFWYFYNHMIPVLVFWQPHGPLYPISHITFSISTTTCLSIFWRSPSLFSTLFKIQDSGFKKCLFD